jgi:hypothetical protein
MSAPSALYGFAYGEDLDSLTRRSLGFRLLAPAEPEPWRPEVEALARSLQACPYPDHWPSTQLFCSVLLQSGQRVIAVARYGLCDQTASGRRGCLELFGVVAPSGMSVSTALATYHWLRQRRDKTDDLRTFGARFGLADIPALDAPPLANAAPLPLLPIRLWQDGGLVFAATSPADPDYHLALLEQEHAPNWQWLPLVGPDFPIQMFLQRGPLVGWTPHLIPVAMQVERHSTPTGVRPAMYRNGWAAALGVILLLLLGANLWATLTLPARLPSSQSSTHVDDETRRNPAKQSVGKDDSADRFARALYRLLPPGEFSKDTERSLNQYKRLAAQHKDLHINSKEGMAVVAAVRILSRRQVDRIESQVRQALSQKKGYDPELVDLACRRIREYLAAGVDGTAP